MSRYPLFSHQSKVVSALMFGMFSLILLTSSTLPALPRPAAGLESAYDNIYFVIPSPQERTHIHDDNSYTDNRLVRRFCKDEGHITYRFALPQGVKKAFLSMMMEGQVHLQVSSDGRTFKELYKYKGTDLSVPRRLVGPQGDNLQVWHYDLSPHASDSRTLYVRVSDAVPGDEFCTILYAVLVEMGEPRQYRTAVKFRESRPSRHIVLSAFQIWTDFAEGVPEGLLSGTVAQETPGLNRVWELGRIKHWIDEAASLGCFNAIDLGDDHEPEAGRLFTPDGLNPSYGSLLGDAAEYAHSKGLMVIVEPWDLQIPQEPVDRVDRAKHKERCLEWAKSFLAPELGGRAPDIVKLSLEPLGAYANNPDLAYVVGNYLDAVRQVNPKTLVIVDSVSGFWCFPSEFHFWLMSKYPEIIISHYTRVGEVAAFELMGARNMAVQLNPGPLSSGFVHTGQKDSVDGALAQLEEAYPYKVRYLELSGQHFYDREVWSKLADSMRPHLKLARNAEELRTSLRKSAPARTYSSRDVEQAMLARIEELKRMAGAPSESPSAAQNPDKPRTQTVVPVGAGSRRADAVPQVIVYGAGQAEAYRHAAEELARYIKLITGHSAKIVTDRAPLSAGWKNVVLIGDSAHNRTTKQITDGRLCEIALPRGDGFGIGSASDGNRNYLVFFGGDGKGMIPDGNSRGTLYAVYDYLEKECGVGFFEDGDRVPKMAGLPFQGINRSESPYFEVRGRNTYFHSGLMKYRANYWTLPEWKRNIDWRLKSKMNFMYAWPLALYKQDPTKRDVFHSQWKEIFDYARARGLKIGYSLDYGQVPDDFVKENKDHKFIQSEVYGLRGLHPDDPLAALYTKQRLESAIADYGTDHFYLCAPYGELKPDEAPLDVRIRATAEFLRVIKTVDPEAIWMTDTWDCLSNDALWTPENLKAYLDSCPSEFLITENGAESIDVRHKYDFFYGKNWLFGMLHSLGGDDELHGDPLDLIQRIQEIVKDPRGAHCKGMLLTPEIAGANILYFDLATRLAWDPSNLTMESFLREYTSRRYGRESQVNMLESISKLVEAMYTGNGFFSENDVATIHQNQYYHQCLRLAPIFEGREEEASKRLADHEREIPLLKDALRAALRERQRQQGSILYESYLVEVTDAYLAKVCNYHLLRGSVSV